MYVRVNLVLFLTRFAKLLHRGVNAVPKYAARTHSLVVGFANFQLCVKLSTVNAVLVANRHCRVIYLDKVENYLNITLDYLLTANIPIYLFLSVEYDPGVYRIAE